MSQGNYCPKCQIHEGGDYNAPENERYCSKCGTELIVKPPVPNCPNCGEKLV